MWRSSTSYKYNNQGIGFILQMQLTAHSISIHQFIVFAIITNNRTLSYAILDVIGYHIHEEKDLLN